VIDAEIVDGVITIPGFGEDDTYTIVVTATDSAGNEATLEFTIVVDTTGPTITEPTAEPDSEGNLDVSVGDAVSATYQINEGEVIDAEIVDGVITIPGFGEDDTYTIVVTATDSAGNEATLEFTIVVVLSNQPPVLAPIGDKEVNTGQILTITLSAFDPEGQDLTFTATPMPGATLTGSVFTWTPLTSGNYQITFEVSDGALSDTEQITITVKNDVPSDTEAPVILNFIANPNPVPINTPVTLTAFIDDQATGNSNIVSVQYSIDEITWTSMTPVDGSFDEPLEDVMVSLPIYPVPEVVSITIRATDQAGHVVLSEPLLLAIYDPSGGFVTGGGWINSPPGAYYPDPTMTGKATFGFVSKYKKGTNVPTGDTEFQFHAAKLNFKSTSYDWLVVAGTKAQFKGTGTINGAGTYSFMLSAIDDKNGSDTFRIKIKDKLSDALVYDNQLDAPDTADPTTVIGGGSIIVHK
jgi:hypothetical protein